MLVIQERGKGEQTKRPSAIWATAWRKRRTVIIVRLSGGLGNQMFQYAAGRRLAHRLKARLKLDVAGFEVDPLRRYGLKYLAIEEHFATPKDIHLFFASARTGWRYGTFLQQLRLKNPYTIHREDLLTSFNPEILTVKGNVYLEGYWQSEKYFHDIQDIIREEFTVKSTPDENNREVLHAICDANSVCLHVRRGDYVTNPFTAEVHGTCPVDYYLTGMEAINARVSKPHYFVFSDDPLWARNNIRPPEDRVTYVTHNSPNRPHEDLRLMYNCKHFIIANSSFSWWGAWLSRNPDKIVMAPQKWLNDTSYDRRDLLPVSWERIDVTVQ